MSIKLISQSEAADLMVKSESLSVVYEGALIINCCKNDELGLFYVISGTGTDNDLLVTENGN